jgi:hypothetical protein
MSTKMQTTLHTKLQPVLTTSSFLREPPVPVLTSVVQLFESIENHDSAPLNISKSDIINININIYIFK